MKKIINNKLYNTDTANSLIYWYNDLPSNDGYYYAEELYIKKTGEYFLYGEGGALSPYAAMIARADVLTLTGTSFH